MVLDNYATDKHAKVLDWIERKKRIFLHFTPTSASWASPPHLEKCLREYLKRHNENLLLLVWTKSLGEIMVKIECGGAARVESAALYVGRDAFLTVETIGPPTVLRPCASKPRHG